MMNRVSGQNDLLKARVADAARLAENGGQPRFVGFLDEREAKVVSRLVEHTPQEHLLLWGGFPEAERVIFGAFPDFSAPDPAVFPIAAFTVSFRKQDTLTHRDFLGALLHAGIERPSLGDILVEPGRAVFFCRREISTFLLTQVEKIGGVGVRISEGSREPLPAAHHFAEFSAVVASARLDCLTAAAVGISREKAAQMIRAQLVEVNHEPVSLPAAEMREGDILSVHGKGRFIFDRLGPFTKKGRLSIAGRKFV